MIAGDYKGPGEDLKPRGPHLRPDDPIVTPAKVDVPEPGHVLVIEPTWIKIAVEVNRYVKVRAVLDLVSRKVKLPAWAQRLRDVLEQEVKR